MRPIKLVMQAFGPYAGINEIDFRELGSRTMFVISGKTGSGKTTIFDGITFAIFGRASGDDRTGTDLRSQFAEDDLPTEVSLRFFLKGKEYEIWRAPQQEKKKSRGEGYTTVGAKAELYAIHEDGTRELLASNVRDTEEKIKEIIQIDVNQFRQILMIPQGEFRKLLVSDSKEKELILQKLFHTEFYKKIEEKMKEMAGEVKQQVASASEERSRWLRGTDPDGDEVLEAFLAEDPVNETAVMERLPDVIKGLKAKEDTLKTDIARINKERDEAKSRFDAGEELRKQFALRDGLRSKKAELDEREPEIAGMRESIVKAEKADRLAQQEALCKRLSDAWKRLNRELEVQSKKLEEAQAELEKAKLRLDGEMKKQPEREEAQQELARLAGMQEEIELFDSREKAKNGLFAELGKMKALREKEEEQLARMKEDMAAKKAELQKLGTLRTAFYEMEKELGAKNQKLQVLGRLDEAWDQAAVLERKLAELAEKEGEAGQRAEEAVRRLARLESKWKDGQAGILAAQLEDGAECPVCGSVHHPSPAARAVDVPSEEELNAAKSTADKAGKALRELEAARYRLEAEKDAAGKTISRLQSELEEETSQETIKAVKKEEEADFSLRQAEAEKSGNLLSRLEPLEAELETLAKRTEDLGDSLRQRSAAQNELEIQYAETAATLEASIRRIPEDLRSKDAFLQAVRVQTARKKKLETEFEEARAAHSRAGEAVAGLVGSVGHLRVQEEAAKKELDAEKEIFRAKMKEEAFAAYADYDGAKKTKTELEELQAAIQLFGEERRSVMDRLAEAEARLENTVLPDLDALNKAWQEKEEESAALGDRQAKLALCLHMNEEIFFEAARISEAIKEAEKQYEIIGHLADITRGQNTYRLTFERFVLASFLDDILSAANARLHKMTGGRYELLRKTDRSKGNVQSGLELLVFDQYTGQERHVKTLSGGESFKAALSLALGLADIVQEHAGGVSLETMFIDEGFGTLDPESLDQAIEALMDIQSSGRLVGIISHVPELKERIDARLDVTATQSGSMTEFVFLS